MGGDTGRDPGPKAASSGALRSHRPAGPPRPPGAGPHRRVQWAVGRARLHHAFLPGPRPNAAATNENQKAVWEWEPTSLPCLEKGLMFTEAAGGRGANGLWHPPPAEAPA